jgi:hypothetical protein
MLYLKVAKFDGDFMAKKILVWTFPKEVAQNPIFFVLSLRSVHGVSSVSGKLGYI